MKKLFWAGFLYLALLFPGFAQSIPFPGPGGVGTGVAPAVLSFITNLQNAGGTATQTFTAASIGTAAGDRFVIVGVVIGKDSGTWSANPISSLTIAGNAATLIGSQTLCAVTATCSVALYGLAVPTGTTANIVVNMAAAGTAGIAIWKATGLISTTPTATANDNATPFTQTLVIPTSGFGIGFVGGESVTSFTWTNMTERSDATVSIYTGSGADNGTAGSPSITATQAAGTRVALVLAAWN